MNSKAILVISVLFMLLLSACGFAGSAAPAASTGCPDATVEMRVLKDAERGFCLQYPRGYQVVPSEMGVGLVYKSQLNVEDPRLGITVTDAAGSTLEEVAAQIEANVAIPGMDVERSATTVAGEPAIMFDNLPGQDLNRRVLFIRDGKLFELFFTPLDKNPEQFEAFYDTIVTSFTFPSSPEELVVQAEEQCPMAGDGEQLFRYDTAGFCFVHPADFTVEEAGDGVNLLYVGSMMDVSHPKLFVEVLDAAGRSAEQVADEMLAVFSLPEGQVDRPFGLLLGGEPAALLDNMPGQDISRQVIAVKGNRAYRLTFVPSDPTAGEVYAEMEALYTLVTDTFTFLPSDEATAEALPALVWEGPSLSGADCTSLVIAENGQMRVGACGGATTPVDASAANQVWADTVVRFAPFEYSAGDERVVFRGSGAEVAGPAWQRAIATWARFTEAELASGRVGAATRTTLSWWLGEVPEQAGYCKQLVVLNFGYAYANVSPCDGKGEGTLVAAGWVDTAEWEQFDGWLYGSETVYRGNDYFAGAGSETLSADDIDVWAQTVYARLTG